MKKILLVAAIGLAISGCQLRNQDSATAVGAVAGGLLGNTIGKGSTRTIATVGGAVAGAVVGSQVGRHMDMDERDEFAERGNRRPYAPQSRPLRPVYGDCEEFVSNKPALEACKRGVEDRRQEEQMLLEAEAYEKGRGNY